LLQWQLPEPIDRHQQLRELRAGVWIEQQSLLEWSMSLHERLTLFGLLYVLLERLSYAAAL